jgi:TPR repeat protein
VAQPTDESKTGTLPDPELNPLLNPLLAANMGRWAEVYFTNPPDKRAQAVADLLRELEQNPQPEPVLQSDPPKMSAAKAAERVPQLLSQQEQEIDQRDEGKHEDVLIRHSYDASAAANRTAEEATLVCRSCGHANEGTQRFCGMCGMPLTHPVAFIPTTEPPVRQGSWHDQDAGRDARPIANERGFYEEPQSEYPPRSNELASLYPMDDGNDEVHDPAGGLFQYEPAPRRSYRLYIGIAAVIVLGLLVYRAWRGNATFSSGGSVPSTLPQAVPSSQEPEAAKPAEPAAAAPGQSSSANSEANGTVQNPAVKPQTKPTPTNRSLNARHTASPSENKLTSASEQASIGAQNGAEELATAEKYLNGAHDPQQAAPWLWKSVAKQNLTAALLLSDLYVHGDGVAKNCDQARLLLDAAARKGSAAAAVRLRNLPAFGCQ